MRPDQASEITEKLAIGRRLLDQGFGWVIAAREAGMTYEKFRRALDPDYLARRQKYEHERRPLLMRRNRRQARSKFKIGSRIEPGEAAIQERNNAFSKPISITAFVLGDPPPGRSALDKKLGQANG